jgi:hypothetical protein
MELRMTACLVVLLVAVTAVHAQAPLYLVPQDAMISGLECDGPFCVEVHIGECTGIKGYDISITFDATYLSFGGVYESDFFDSSAFYPLPVDNPPFVTVIVNCGNLGTVKPGPGHLYTICFGPPYFCTPADAPTSVVFDDADVRDQTNQPYSIPVGTFDGTVTIRCGDTAVDATAWGGIKCLYR